MHMPIDFDDIEPGMTITRDNGTDQDTGLVTDVDLEGGWLDLNDGQTWFRHDLNNTWAYLQHINTRPLERLVTAYTIPRRWRRRTNA